MKDTLRQTSLKYMQREGGFAGAMQGISNSYIAPFAIFLGAGPFLASIIQTLPNLIGSILQTKTPKITKLFVDQRSYLIALITIHALTLITIPLVYFFSIPLVAMITIICISATINLLTVPVWTAYMGDLVSDRERSTYYSKRNALVGGMTFVGTLVGAAILGFTKTTYLSFTLIFSIASILRIFSCRAFIKSRPQKFSHDTDGFSIKEFTKRMPHSDFGKFVRFIMAFRFSMFIAAPFFVIYQIQVLGFSYVTYALIIAAFTLSGIFGNKVWRKVAQGFGTQRVLIGSSLLVAIIPLLWILTRSPIGILIVNVVGGFAVAGLEQSQGTYILESTKKQSRIAAASYYNLFTHTAVFLGSMIGFGLLTALTGFEYTSATPFLALFFVSGLLRLLVWARYHSTLKELRFLHIALGGGEVVILPQQAGAARPVMAMPVNKTLEKKIARVQRTEKLRAGDYMRKLSLKEREFYTKQLILRAQRK